MSNHILINLDYPAFLHDFYQKLCHLPGFALLESADYTQGRYDIISAYPYDRIVVTDNSINKEALLNKIKARLAIKSSAIDLPFQGGAIGYISYDLGAALYGINTQARQQAILPNLPKLNLGLYDWALIVDHHVKKVTLFAANRYTATASIIDEILSLWHAFRPDDKVFQVSSTFRPLISQSAYEKSFNAIHQALYAGRCYQVNLTQPFCAEHEGDVWQMYKKVLAKNPVPFAAYITTQEATILSFSPERFLLYDKGALLTSPIKGTIGRSLDPIEDEQLKNQLINCAKNRAENVMIVDLLRNDLGKIAYPGSVKVTKLCGVQSYNALHHLVSDIKAQCLASLHPFAAFLACFPGGSITGAPKFEAMKVINEQESYTRGIYCGSIGYFSHHGRFDTNIAIRTVTTGSADNKLHLAAGGGIVIDSKWEEEYQEAYIKIQAIINRLANQVFD